MDSTAEHMRVTMQTLEKIFPGCVIALLVMPVGGVAGNRINYISNGTREDMRGMMREVLERWEGRRHDGPTGVQ